MVAKTRAGDTKIINTTVRGIDVRKVVTSQPGKPVIRKWYILGQPFTSREAAYREIDRLVKAKARQTSRSQPGLKKLHRETRKRTPRR